MPPELTLPMARPPPAAENVVERARVVEPGLNSSV